jgi:hypothetical protein
MINVLLLLLSEYYLTKNVDYHVRHRKLLFYGKNEGKALNFHKSMKKLERRKKESSYDDSSKKTQNQSSILWLKKCEKSVE